MGMTRQLVYVKRKKGAGGPSQKSRMNSLPHAGSKPKAANVAKAAAEETTSRMERPVDYVPRSARAEPPNWYLRFIATVGILGGGAVWLVNSDLGARA